MEQAGTRGTLGAALIVILVGSAIFTFGTFGVRAKLPGSRALQVIGAATVIFAVVALVSTV